MDINLFPKHIFWNYKDGADLPESIIIEQVLLYGDISEFKILFNTFSKKNIESILLKIKKTRHWEKRINFIEQIFLYK